MGTFIIAEAGVNHNGNVKLALALVDAAVKAGADCVKFQTFKAEALVSMSAKKAAYQERATGTGSQLDMLRQLELKDEDFYLIKEHCDCLGIEFLSTPFDMSSVDLLNELGVKRWKVSSGDITNLPMLIRLAHTHKPIILSTGMCTLEEIENAVRILHQNGAGELTLLHCTTEYPAPLATVNLRVMSVLRERFKVPVGYSDHTQGIHVPVAAVALGACVLEKHFTLDKGMDGPDHRASLEPKELADMVNAVREIELALGAFDKKPSAAELENREVVRKSIVAARPIAKDEILMEENLTVKRPGNGISPMRWYEVLGRPAIRNFGKDEPIEL